MNSEFEEQAVRLLPSCSVYFSIQLKNRLSADVIPSFVLSSATTWNFYWSQDRNSLSIQSNTPLRSSVESSTFLTNKIPLFAALPILGMC